MAILAALAPATAQAEPPDKGTLWKTDLSGSQSGWQVDAGRTAVAEATEEQAVAASYPADCIGVSDRPHKGTHYPGYANALTRTECVTQRSWQYAYSELYRDRWYGQQFLDSRSSSTPYTYGKVRAIPRWYCVGAGTYTYRVYGYHEVTSGGTLWYKYSYNDNRFTC